MNKTTATWSTGFAMITLLSSDARAWDEDTCSTGSEEIAAGVFLDVEDAGCASPDPLQGQYSAIKFDHAVSHFEFTYMAARCLGVADSKARLIAAADAATDMSSPRCGSQIANSGAAYDGQLYYAGYACGYEPVANVASAATPAVPVLDGALRWRFTDRCSTSTQATLHGHGEFFHYPYWETIADDPATTSTNEASKTNVMSSLRAWAGVGVAPVATLFDPSEIVTTGTVKKTNTLTPCDMASGATSKQCAYNSPFGLTELYSSSATVCSFASSYSSSSDPNTDAHWVIPTSSTEDAPKRFGIYLHALGDFYSHRTCQQHSKQAGDANSTDITKQVYVPVTGTATDHVDYVKDTDCGTDGKDCYDSCSLEAHDLEYGGKADTNQIQELRDATITGLKDVWTQIATFEGRSERDRQTAEQFGGSIVTAFAGKDTASGRQTYVHDWMTNNGAVSPGTQTNAQCLCPFGLYDWVPQQGTLTGGVYVVTVPAHCSTIAANAAVNTAIKLSTSSSPTSTAQPSVSVGVNSTVTVRAWGQGKKLGSTIVDDIRDVRQTADWVVTNTSIATVENNFSIPSTIGRITGKAVGSTTLTVTRLGSTATITITVP